MRLWRANFNVIGAQNKGFAIILTLKLGQRTVFNKI